ncbi:hypothetical protein FRB94_004448 [Tulasnella sp. JGI-2019a]|nr:hypothetical protein FRB93_003594 [Tulasnella sp. JGI-2019a]KAG9001916.1 hypothetical protein FRB94_004448 [Tulasnella sp. JGI-2019a]
MARQGPLMELGELAEITGHEEALELGKKFGERELDKEVEKQKQEQQNRPQPTPKPLHK